MSKVCYLPKIEVTLADGKVYNFRKLPLTETVVKAAQDLQDGSKSLQAMFTLVKVSLSYDYSPEEIAYVFESGLIPFDPELVLNMLAGIFPQKA